MMIHNPMTAAFGSKDEMEKAIEMLEEVKESIINAYELRTGLSRARISHLMDSETWMNAKRAIELGFADGMLTDEKVTAEMPAFEFSDRAVEMALINKITAKTRKHTQADKQDLQAVPEEATRQEPTPKHGRSVAELMERLNLLKN
jgi:ATP-dependent Clp protease protease subunit